MSPHRAAPAFTTFATALGECALAWAPGGIVGIWLPGGRPDRLVPAIRRRLPGAEPGPPDAERQGVVDSIRRLLDGERVDLRHVRLDSTAIEPFNRRVYAVARDIPPGRVLTYATVATRVGAEASARDVGRALGENPFPIVVPCHRVVAANGRLGGFSAPGGAATKRKLLAIEAARLDGGPDLFDSVERDGEEEAAEPVSPASASPTAEVPAPRPAR